MGVLQRRLKRLQVCDYGWHFLLLDLQRLPTAYLNLPTGWELAPADGDGIRIGTGLAWGTHVVVFSNGESYRTYNFGGASNKNRYTATNYLATSTLNGAPAYKPNGCHLRILIRASLSC